MNTVEKSKTYLFVEREEIEEIITTAVKKALITNGKKEEITFEHGSLENMLSLEDAMRMLGRKNTWFYNMRVSGKLRAIKAGNKWWYEKEALVTFIKSGEKS